VPVPDAPIAGNVTYGVNQDIPLSIPAPGVLVRSVDNDPGDKLTAVFKSNGPLNGVVSLSPDGSFIYTPNREFSGVDGFDFSVLDSTGLSSALARASFIVCELRNF
jgi:hypothetical protein